MIHRFVDLLEVTSGVVPFVLYTNDTGGSPVNAISVWYLSQSPGSDLTQIPGYSVDQLSGDDLADPVHSPDGTMVVWAAVNSAAACQIDGYALDGSWGTPGGPIGSLQPSLLFTSMQPWWKPDSSGIVYRTLDNSPSEGVIRTCDIDPLTGASSNDTAVLTLARTNGDVVFPTYNHDGTKIVYGRIKSAAADEIWVMEADGSNNTMIVSSGEGTLENGRAFAVAYTQDKVAYSKVVSGVRQIRVVDLDGTNDTLLFSDPGIQYMGITRRAWAADDSAIMFFSRDGTDPTFDLRLYSIDPAGGGGTLLSPERLSSGLSNDFLAFVFGNRVYWASGDDADTTDIVSCLLDGTDLRTEFSCSSPPAPYDAISWIGGFAGRNNQPT